MKLKDQYFKYLGNVFVREVNYKNRFRYEERYSHRTGDSSLKYTNSAGKANVNFTLEQATMAQRGKRGIALFFL